MNTKNVLVFPGGTEIGLEISRSLNKCKDIALFSAGSDISNHAPYIFKRHFVIPDVHTNNWIAILNEIVVDNNINFIYPAHDDVIVALVNNSEKIMAQIVTSPLKTCLVCRSKLETYDLLRNVLPTPHVFHELPALKDYPVFVKPDIGQGSQNTYKVKDLDQLIVLKANIADLLVLEYLSGKEYTVDCFTDCVKGLLFCSGRERIRIKSGISMNSKPVSQELNAIFREYAKKISEVLEFSGAWFFQVKCDEFNEFKLLEIAPRISGTMATHRVMGINFPLLSIYNAEGIDIEIMINHYEVEIDRALINRYRHTINYNTIYVDLDDTIIIKNSINTDLVKFLYQGINNGYKLILITKTTADIGQYLEKWRLDKLFDEVIVLDKSDDKYKYICGKKSIFIDDSFSERKKVHEKLGIPTFDCSMIELLIDERNY